MPFRNSRKNLMILLVALVTMCASSSLASAQNKMARFGYRLTGTSKGAKTLTEDYEKKTPRQLTRVRITYDANEKVTQYDLQTQRR